MIGVLLALSAVGWLILSVLMRPYASAIWLHMVVLAAMHSVICAANAVISLLPLADQPTAFWFAVTSGVSGWVAWSYWSSRPRRRNPSKVLARVRAMGRRLVVEPVRGS